MSRYLNKYSWFCQGKVREYYEKAFSIFCFVFPEVWHTAKMNQFFENILKGQRPFITMTTQNQSQNFVEI